MDIIMNSGSLVIIIGLMIMSYIAMKIIFIISKKLYKFRIMRKIGIIATTYAVLQIPLEKMIIESYLDILLAAFLNLVGMLISKDTDDYLDWWSTFPNLLCTVLTYLSIIIVLYLPHRMNTKIR